MRDLCEVLDSEPDDADADALDGKNCVRLNLLNSRDIRGQDWKARFFQAASQLRDSVVEFMIAESDGSVSQPVHDFDHRLAEEFVADHGSGEHVAAIEQQVGLFAADQRSRVAASPPDRLGATLVRACHWCGGG